MLGFFSRLGWATSELRYFRLGSTPGYPQPRSSKRKGGRGESTSPNTSDDTKHDGSTGTKTLCFTLISNQLKHNQKTQCF